MRCYLIRIIIGIGIAVMTESCAEHRPSAKEPAAMERTPIAPPPLGDFEGTISRIDAEKGLVTVEHWPLSKTFQVPPSCLIDILTNENAVLTQLKVNDPVVVMYSEAGGNPVAKRIVRRGKAYEQERREKMERLDEMLNPSPNQ